jgi:ATP phosphoribosyltransferase
MSANQTQAPLVIAVPSKGRLQENATAFFARAGLNLVQARGAREYRGQIAGMPDVEVAYLSASDIAGQLAQGAVHLGVTGEDLIREQVADADQSLEMLTPLGFGHANVVVAVPQAWIDVRTMADLDDVAAGLRQKYGRRLRVATKYINLTRRFFATHAVGDYQIVESLGATEGAPAAGTAEIVVDITTTGATLGANGLKIPDDGIILKSQANLVAALNADWSPRAKTAAQDILSRIAAEEEARLTREVCAVLPARDAAGQARLLTDLAQRFAARLPFDPGESAGTVTETGCITLHCPAQNGFALAAALSSLGCDTVTVRALDYIICRNNELQARLMRRIGP